MTTSKQNPRTLIASHRGGALLWPENSLTAFRRTVQLPVEQVEFDVHLARDGAIIVHHDPTLDRMTDRTGAIADMTSVEIECAKINGTDNDTVPRFEHVLDIFEPSPLTLRIEIKADANMQPYVGLERKIADVLGESGLEKRTVITSFWLPVLMAYRQLDPAMPLIWLVAPQLVRQIGSTKAIATIAREHGLDAITYRINVITADDMLIAGDQDLRLSTYAANDPMTIQRALDLGVEVFTTDRPDLALKLRDALET